MCFPPRSQTAHCGVKIEIFVNLWLLLKGQSGQTPLGVNTSFMKDNVWIIKRGLTKPKILTPRWHAHHRVEIVELYDWISRRNWNRIRKYFSQFIIGQDGFSSWKKLRSKILWRTPLKNFYQCSPVINVVIKNYIARSWTGSQNCFHITYIFWGTKNINYPVDIPGGGGGGTYPHFRSLPSSFSETIGSLS